MSDDVCPFCTDGRDPRSQERVCGYCMGVRIYPRLAEHQDFNRYTGDPANPLRPASEGYEMNDPPPAPTPGNGEWVSDGEGGWVLRIAPRYMP